VRSFLNTHNKRGCPTSLATAAATTTTRNNLIRKPALILVVAGTNHSISSSRHGAFGSQITLERSQQKQRSHSLYGALQHHLISQFAHWDAVAWVSVARKAQSPLPPPLRCCCGLAAAANGATVCIREPFPGKPARPPPSSTPTAGDGTAGRHHRAVARGQERAARQAGAALGERDPAALPHRQGDPHEPAQPAGARGPHQNLRCAGSLSWRRRRWRFGRGGGRCMHRAGGASTYRMRPPAGSGLQHAARAACSRLLPCHACAHGGKSSPPRHACMHACTHAPHPHPARRHPRPVLGPAAAL